MHFFPSREIFLSIGSIEIRWYATLIMTGSLICYAIGDYRLKKAGYDRDVMDDLFIGCMFCGILGARIWYVLFSDLQAYLKDPISIIQIWKGGLAIHGAVLGGLAYALFYCRKHRYSFAHIFDMIMPTVLIAQALGRWGNYLNGECYGPIVEESFFVGPLKLIKDGMLINGSYRMPMFFFESCLNLLGFILITLYQHHGRKLRGNGFFGYFAWYGVVRFWIESFRTDSLMIGPFKMAQVVSIIGLVIGLLGLTGCLRKVTGPGKPLIIFDLDGTLLDTEKAIISSFEKVLGAHKPELVLTEKDKVSFLGPTLAESFQKYAPELDTDQLVSEYREINRQAHYEGLITPCKHVPELLEYLKNNGYDMAIASSKKKETVELGLQCCNLQDYFKVIIGVEQVTNPKPDRETIVKTYREMGYGPDNVIYVGDSEGDVKCARNAGSFSIAVVANELKREELAASKPNRLIDDMIEIEEILKEDHPWTYNMM